MTLHPQIEPKFSNDFSRARARMVLKLTRSILA